MIRTSIVVVVGIIAWAICGIGQAAERPKVIAEGDWSASVTDSRGYGVRGRLVLCEKLISPERREVAVYVELQDACDFRGSGMQLFCDLGKRDFRPEHKGGLRCEMRDKDKQLVKSTSFPFGGGVPGSQWVTLPSDATIRVRASPFGLHRPNAMAIAPDLRGMWVIGDDDAGEYFLSGTFTVDPADDSKPSGEGHVWRGTIELPAIRIVNHRK